jgi:hypothetical protein
VITRTIVTRLAVGAVTLALAATAARAQGTLGAQGFGYPPGQLSVFSRSVGGATAEVDPISPINPASLILLRRGGLYIQSEQESRSLDAEGGSGSTRAYRFPLFVAAVPVGTRGMISVSFSTMLDRTWGTQARVREQLGDDSVSFTETFKSEGALNDVRAGGAWAIRDNVIVGAGIHLFPGENRLSISREFDDSLVFAPLRDSANVNYFGSGVSGGVLWRPARTLTIGASGRWGGSLKLRESDTLVAKANAPSRFGAGLRYDVVPGTAVALRVDRTLWSKMEGLGSVRATPEDSWDFGLGVDAVGPRLGGSTIALRGGFRRRTLPFLASDARVRETAFTFGSGMPFAGGRAQLDLGLERAARSASDVDAKERSWTLGLGLTVRP